MIVFVCQLFHGCYYPCLYDFLQLRFLDSKLQININVLIYYNCKTIGQGKELLVLLISEENYS